MIAFFVGVGVGVLVVGGLVLWGLVRFAKGFNW